MPLQESTDFTHSFCNQKMQPLPQPRSLVPLHTTNLRVIQHSRKKEQTLYTPWTIIECSTP